MKSMQVVNGQIDSLKVYWMVLPTQMDSRGVLGSMGTISAIFIFGSKKVKNCPKLKAIIHDFGSFLTFFRKLN